MKRNEAIELLSEYNNFLMEEGYADTDLFQETPTAIDQFLNTTWAKENLPIVLPTESEILVQNMSQDQLEYLSYLQRQKEDE